MDSRLKTAYVFTGIVVLLLIMMAELGRDYHYLFILLFSILSFGYSMNRDVRGQLILVGVNYFLLYFSIEKIITDSDASVYYGTMFILAGMALVTIFRSFKITSVRLKLPEKNPTKYILILFTVTIVLIVAMIVMDIHYQLETQESLRRHYRQPENLVLYFILFGTDMIILIIPYIAVAYAVITKKDYRNGFILISLIITTFLYFADENMGNALGNLNGSYFHIKAVESGFLGMLYFYIYFFVSVVLFMIFLTKLKNGKQQEEPPHLGVDSRKNHEIR